MWRRYLSSELFWHFKGGDKPLPRPKIYRAPTFSWASIDGEVVPDRGSYEQRLIEVLEVDLKYLTGDSFGRLTGGSLLMKCQLRRAYFTHSAVQAATLKHNIQYLDDSLLGETQEHSAVVLLDECPTHFDPANEDQDSFYSVAGRIDYGDQDNLYSVAGHTDDENLDNRIFTHSLLLQAVDAQTGTFRRFGYLIEAESSQSRANRSSPKSLDTIEFPCVDYREGWHTIRLI